MISRLPSIKLWRNAVRKYFTAVTSRLPNVRGRGRMVMLVDRFLTDYTDRGSYITVGTLNRNGLFEFDLRAWGQNFAFYYRSWEEEYVDLMRRLYSGGIFIDVGSSLGLYVVGLAQVVRAHQGRIISIEPVLFNLQRQMYNVRLNVAGDLVNYVSDAVGSHSGSAKIRADPTRADNNALIADDGTINVTVVRLDDIVQQYAPEKIGMIKMDIEGYEPLAIEGARKTLREHQPIVLAECNRERMSINGLSMDDVWSVMRHEIGYRCYWLDTCKATLVPLDDPGETENILFCPQQVVDTKLRGASGAIPLAAIKG